mmetsp:Transcript_9435/g.34635  ORF Transcript_9435/g.34635 Transcript_9435/m.34635 type:complete len:160 (-) Transcript_9435:220-699(-)
MAEVDFEPAEDELLDEEAMDAEEGAPVSTDGKKKKGRGFREARSDGGRPNPGAFEALDASGGPGPLKSVEGWIIIVTNMHEEAGEDDVHEAFSDYGEIKNVHLNLDRRTGFVKGYALIEYESKKEAQDAIDAMNGQEILTQKVSVGWAFSKGPSRRKKP